MGKRLRWNKEANAKLTEIFISKGILFCEIQLPGCDVWYNLNFCHKEKRRHYNSMEELCDFNEVLLGCNHCHTILDDRSKTTKEESDAIFERRRNDRQRQVDHNDGTQRVFPKGERKGSGDRA